MRVLVATDLSEAADVALRDGSRLASGPESALAAVHVLPPQPFIDAWLPNLGADGAKILAARAEKKVHERLGSVVGARPAEVFIDDDVDYAAIIRRAEAWKADVVVLGAHGRSGLVQAFGGVVERVLRHAPCSVLVARSPAAHGWVLAATDLSSSSIAAVTTGAEEAGRRGARLEVVRAMGFLDVEAAYLVELGTPSLTPPPLVLETAARELSERVARLHVEATCKILDRPAAAAIVHEAEALGAELVVVGARGRLGLMALGGVAEKVARTAPCSVLAVRPRADG